MPKTIDNDLDKTFTTFGFDTAVSFATECLDRLHTTAESHQRIIVVEVMGRYAGWIALHSGISGGAHAILIPEIPFDLDKVVEKIRLRDGVGRVYSLIVVAEGANADATASGRCSSRPKWARPSGWAASASRWRRCWRSAPARTPAPWCWVTSCAAASAHLVRPAGGDALRRRRRARARRGPPAGSWSRWPSPTCSTCRLAEVAGRMKAVPLDSDTLLTGRDLGICFGD